MRRLAALIGMASFAGVITVRDAVAQLSIGIGPSARGTSTDATGWVTAAQLSSSFRFDHPFALFTLDDVVEREDGSLRPGPMSLSSTLLTPSVRGFRLVATSAVERDHQLVPPGDRRSASASLSYRHAASGAWLGLGAERYTTPGIVTGLWRQFGSRASISIGSTIRRSAFGGGVSSHTYFDSLLTDSGWVQRSHTVGGSGPSARLIWAETEARLGWTVGRVALDGVVGWRPRLDSTSREASWVQAFATVAIARNVALCLGAGTVAQQVPFMPGSSRFGSVALRLAPAALVRPKSPPQITPTAGTFTVRKNDAGEYVVSVRVPRARTVEISGDFNGWMPLSLEQVRGDVWEVALTLAPGTYHVNLRVDGERWIAPPGTTSVDDEFNGRVGLVIVR